MPESWNDFLVARGLLAGRADFGDGRAELIAARDDAVLVPLIDFGLVRVTGEDAGTFLHNLLSNDVKTLPADAVRLAGFCSAKGRLLATMLVWKEGNDFLLLLPTDLLPAVAKKLSMYVLRSKVRLSEVGGDRILLGLVGPSAASALATFGMAAPAEMRLTAAPAGQILALTGDRYLLSVDAADAANVWDKLAGRARPAGPDVWQWAEIAAGLPRIVAATQEAFVPQMVNFELVGGVSFTKGCYPGQEIVARTHYLGKIKKRMFRGRLASAVPPGTPLFAADSADQSCGTMVQVAASPEGGYEGLAVIQTTSAAVGEVRIGAIDGEPFSLTTLPYEVPL